MRPGLPERQLLLSVDGTTVTVTYEDDDPSIYRVKSGENITLSNIEDLADKSWIIVAENGILTVDEDYDLTKIAGAGTIVIDADVTLSDSKSTYATGKLTINEGKTLTIGTNQNHTNSIESFTSIDLAGMIYHKNSKATLNNVTVPAGKTGKIFAYDMGADADGFKLAGTTTLSGNLTVCSKYNFQMKVDELAGSGTWLICGTTDGDFDDTKTSSSEAAVINIASASTFTGAVNVNNTQATTTVSGNLVGCTIRKTNGTLNYAGTSLNGTTMDGVNLTGDSRVDVAGTLNLANISNNHTGGSNGYVFAQQTEVSNVVMNFTGTSDLTNGGSNAYNKIGLSSGSIVNVNSGSLKLGGYFNGSSSNGSLYVASGATFETTGSSNTNNNIIFPSSTIAGTAKLIGTWQGTSAITLNDGAIFEVAKTVAGKVTVADGASVTVKVTSTSGLTTSGSATYSDGENGIKTQGYKIATDASSNVTAVEIGDDTYDVSGGVFYAEDGLYHVRSEVSTSDKDLSGYDILVENNATLTVDENLTMASGKKITAEAGGSIDINEGFTLDATAQAANRAEHRALITAASGDGTLKLNSEYELIVGAETYSSPLEINANVVYVSGDISLIGGERVNDKLIVNAGKSLTVNGDLKVLRSTLTANGTVVANTIKIGHQENGAYTGVLNISDGATVKTGQIYFQNKGGGSALNMTGGTLEFTDEDKSPFGTRVNDVTYSISITGGTLKTSVLPTTKDGDNYVIAQNGTFSVSGAPLQVGEKNYGIVVESNKMLVKAYNLTVGSTGYATLCLPYKTIIPSGIYAYKAQVNDNIVSLTKINQEEGLILPQETGVVINSEQGTYEFIAGYGDAISVSDNSLVGVITDTDLPEGAYILAKSGDNAVFKLATGTLKANKAYLTTGTGARQQLSITWADDNPTGIESIFKTTNAQNGKFLNNGHIIIVKDGIMYNVAGQIMK